MVIVGRVISHRLPACPGRDSRFTIKHNDKQPGRPFWVFYEAPNDIIPADDPHTDLVALVNQLKEDAGNQPGGSFSINEHCQVVARMAAPAGAKENAVHVAAKDVSGNIMTYSARITFQQGQLDPTAAPTEGAAWTGPLCGMTYSFASPSNPKPPSRNLDEVWVEVEGRNVQLSEDAKIDPYPPPPGSGPLADLLAALRRQLPNGGRFRVNEHGRVFTSDSTIFVGTIPRGQWFRPLNARS
jgi:hypothetical protein